MKKLRNNQTIGRKAQKNGDNFESQTMQLLERIGARVDQIPSGAKWIGPKRTIPVKTPFDFIVSLLGEALFFDAKSCGDTNFSYSQLSKKRHQVESLNDHFQQGILAGYLIWFSKTKTLCFFSGEKLATLKKGESLSSKDSYDHESRILKQLGVYSLA